MWRVGWAKVVVQSQMLVDPSNQISNALCENLYKCAGSAKHGSNHHRNGQRSKVDMKSWNRLLVAFLWKNDIVVLRHGKSIANEQHLIVSKPPKAIDGYGLSKTGRAQAAAVTFVQPTTLF